MLLLIIASTLQVLWMLQIQLGQRSLLMMICLVWWRAPIIWSCPRTPQKYGVLAVFFSLKCQLTFWWFLLMGYCYCLDRKSCARSCFMRSWKAEDRLIFHKKYIISELTYRGQFYAGVSFLVGPYNKGWGYQPRSKRLQGREPSPHSDAGAAVNFSFLLHLFSYIFSLSPTITNLQLLSLRKFNTFWFVYDLFPLGRLGHIAPWVSEDMCQQEPKGSPFFQYM